MKSPFAVADKYLDSTGTPKTEGTIPQTATRIRIGEQALTAARAEETPRAWVIEEFRNDAGETMAVKICSAPLEAHVWILNDPDFIPPDDDPIFFADEFEYLEAKSIDELRGALKAKIAFPRARIVQ